jgi:hypothetical protein
MSTAAAALAGRLSLLWQPMKSSSLRPALSIRRSRPTVSIRQEVFNLYLNEFTDPAYEYDKREQYLLLREDLRMRRSSRT